MKKATKMKICDVTLLVLAAVMLLSGVQLELNPFGLDAFWVWAHIVLGALFILLIVWHLRLHHHHRPGASRSAQQQIHARSHAGGAHRALAIFFLLTALSAIAATVHWLDCGVHSTIGGIHGKLGFIFIILIILHVKKHFAFYRAVLRKARR